MMLNQEAFFSMMSASSEFGVNNTGTLPPYSGEPVPSESLVSLAGKPLPDYEIWRFTASLKKPLVFRDVGLKSGLGETTFQIGLRYKPTNAMIRLERHSANLIGGGRTYYTHFNTLPISRLNHFGLNPLKWGKIKY
jgi:hypothetical protein